MPNFLVMMLPEIIVNQWFRGSLIWILSLLLLTSNGLLSQINDLEVIHQRLVNNLLENPPDDETVSAVIEGLTPEGKWPDIDYVDTSRTGFEHGRHLSRMVHLSMAYQAKKSKYYHSPVLLEDLSSTLNFWLDHDFICANWWWNQIGTPRSLVEVLLLMRDELTDVQLDQTVKILDRANLNASGARPSGDRIKIAGILAKKLLVLGDAKQFDAVIKVIEGEIKFSRGRGMQVDYSFHHRKDRVNNTLSYGLGYAQAFAEWAALVTGTKYEFGESSIHQLVDYYLDGICKMLINGKYPDPGAKNRSVSREGTLRGYGVKTIDELMKGAGYREEELETIKAIRMGNAAQPQNFNKFFWQSEYMSHQRPGYFTSARMYSTRNQNMEYPYNMEGLKNHYLGDGSNFISRTGKDYFNIFPVLDWRRIPGTTVVQKPGMPSEKEVQVKGVTDFVGGVSDGVNGCAAFDYLKERDSLQVRKSWFFFEDGFVCLGAGMTSNSIFQVNTTINQSLLNGKVYVSNDIQDYPVPNQEQQVFNDINWVWQDSIGYVFPAPTDIKVSNQLQHGSWYDISQQSDSPKEDVQKNIFKLWLDHGTQPVNSTYSYFVFPSVSLTDMETKDYSDYIQILANQKSIQAVQQRLQGIVGAVFYEEGSLKISTDLMVRMDNPGMVLISYSNSEIRTITVSDPSRKLSELHFSISSKLTMEEKDDNVYLQWDADGKQTNFRILLPRDEFAGSSVIINF